MVDNKPPSLAKLKKFDSTFPVKLKEAASALHVGVTTVIRWLWEDEHTAIAIRPLLPLWNKYQEAQMASSMGFSQPVRQAERNKWKRYGLDK